MTSPLLEGAGWGTTGVGGWRGRGCGRRSCNGVAQALAQPAPARRWCFTPAGAARRGGSVTRGPGSGERACRRGPGRGIEREGDRVSVREQAGGASASARGARACGAGGMSWHAEGRARARWLGCGMGECERVGRADWRAHARRGRGGKARVGRAPFHARTSRHHPSRARRGGVCGGGRRGRAKEGEEEEEEGWGRRRRRRGGVGGACPGPVYVCVRGGGGWREK
jgi:hypothetical protein